MITERLRFGNLIPCARVDQITWHRPGGAPAPFGGDVCRRGYTDVTGNRARFTRPRPDGRGDFIERDIATGAERVLTTLGGQVIDADARHALGRSRAARTVLIRP